MLNHVDNTIIIEIKTIKKKKYSARGKKKKDTISL